MSRKENNRFFTDLGGKRLVDDIKAYERTLKRLDRQFKVKKRGFFPWVALGSIETITSHEHGVQVRCQHGWVELQWVTSDCLRVRLKTQDGVFAEPNSDAIVRNDWSPVAFDVIENATSLEIRSSAMTCLVDKQNFRIRLGTPDRRLMCSDKIGMQWCSDGRVRLSMRLQPDESCFGLGERAFSLGLRGKRLSLWNTDCSDYQRNSDPLYYNIPFYMGVHAQGTYGLLWDNPSRGIVDLGVAKSDEISFESEASELRYYLFVGNDAKQVLARYTELTGRITLPPLWSLGYHQCRFSYYPQDAVLNLAKDFRDRGVPGDVLYLDIHYMSQFRTFTWDEEAFPHFKTMIDELHKQGFKVVAIVDPGIKVDPNDSIYRSLIEQNVYLSYPSGEPAVGVLWPGLCSFPDFTESEARAWWGKQLAPLIDAGVDGIWNDMCEPSVFTQDGSTTLPDYVVHKADGVQSNHLQNHNLYGMLMGRASEEGLQKLRPGRRPFNLIRSGYAGGQRYAFSWTGDNASTWDHLRLSISMALNMGLSGASMTGPDVGGFNGDCDGELFTRWMQAACLLPFFRSHTSLGTHSQEPWSFGQPYEIVNRLAIELRYKLLPYLYSIVAQYREYGWPVIRPVFMAEPDNPSIRSIDDSYLVGDGLLVAPVLEAGAVRRSVYLPAGHWFDYWTNELFTGGQTIEVAAPLERLPLFVKAGIVLPTCAEHPYIQEQGIDNLTYRVYPGNFETIQYEDRGEGFEYLDGDYRWVYVTCEWEEGQLTINRRIAGRYAPLYKVIKLEIVGFEEEPIEVRVDRQGAPLWFYEAGLLELTVDNFQRIEVIRRPQPSDRTLIRRPW